MKIRSAAAVIALVLVAGSAVAADLPSLKSPPPPPLPPPPLWTGFYFGLNAGYSWGATNNVDVATAHFFDGLGATGLGLDPNAAFSALSASGAANVNSNGFIGGAQIGYNYQFYSRFVAGLEVDIQGAGIRGDGGFIGSSAWNAFNVPIIPPLALSLDRAAASSTTITTRTDWLSTARGRIGYAVWPSLLFYATGGLAFGGVQSTVYQSQFINNTLSLTAGGATLASVGFPFASLGGVNRFSETRVGWTVGGGLEWLFAPNVSLKAEYLFYDLGTAHFVNAPLVSVGPTVAVPVLGIIPFGTLNQGVTRVKFDGHIARLGINYHFISPVTPPVLAKY